MLNCVNQNQEIMTDNYTNYLSFIDTKISGFFEKQKPYIFCKKGCGKCCQNAQFPYSQIEITHLLNGYRKLDYNIKQQVLENITKINKQKNEFKDKKEQFKYDCPFLINNECSVYEYRGIVCRTFGLITLNNESGKMMLPFCAYQGLNYSNVLEPDSGVISTDKFKKGKFLQEPLSFNVSYEFLTDTDFEYSFKFEFGERKALIDWVSNLR